MSKWHAFTPHTLFTAAAAVDVFSNKQTRSGLFLQDEKQSEQQRQAELAAFERRNIAMSSDRTTAALVQQGQQDAAGAAKESALQRSGLAIKANADRAKSVQV